MIMFVITISEEEILCLSCNCNEVENEAHFCFIMIIDIQESFYSEISNKCEYSV